MNFGFQNLPYLCAGVYLSGDNSWRTGLAPGLYVVKTLAPLQPGEEQFWPSSGAFYPYDYIGDKLYSTCSHSHPQTFWPLTSNPLNPTAVSPNSNIPAFTYDSPEFSEGTEVHTNDITRPTPNAVAPFWYTVPASNRNTTWEALSNRLLGYNNSFIAFWTNASVSNNSSSPTKVLTEEHKFIDAHDPVD